MPITLLTDPTATVVRTRVPPLVIAHRGASAECPENTLPAFIAAIEQGADMVETDVHMSSDGELIIVHDDTLERTTDARVLYPDLTDLSVGAMSSDQISALDAGSWKGEQFAGAHVPTLAEVIALVREARTGLLLEVKCPSRYPGIAEVIVESLKSAPDYLERAVAAGMLVVQSADWAFVREFHVLAPEIPVGVLGRPCPDEVQGFAGWVDQVNPEFVAADEALLAHIHELGLSSLVWTVDEVADMERAVDLGADGIITNLPARLVHVVDAF